MTEPLKFPKPNSIFNPTSEQYQEWGGDFVVWIRDVFDEVNERTHPLDTTSWLLHWVETKQRMLEAMGEK